MAANGNDLEVLNWHREAGNWLVGLSTGAIATGVLMGTQLKPANSWVKAVFVVAGICFLATILVGMLYYFWILKFGGTKVRKQELANQVASAATSGNPPAAEEMKNLEDELREKGEKLEKARKKINPLHTALLVLFPFGAILAAIGVLGLIIPGAETSRKFSVVSITGDSTVEPRHGRTSLLLSETDGRTWELIRGENGELLWRCVPRTPAIKADSCEASRARRTTNPRVAIKKDTSTSSPTSSPKP